MIRISQIDSGFSIYKNNMVILFGRNGTDREFFQLLKYHKIKPEYICDTNKQNWGEVMRNIQVISPQHLEYMVKNNNQKSQGDIIVQIASKDVDNSVIEKISSLGKCKIISYNEAHKILNLISFISLYQSDPLNPYFTFNNKNNNNKNKNNKNNNNKLVYDILKTNETSPIFIAQTQKTGDITLRTTFTKNNIPNHFTNHNPNFFDKEVFRDKKIKITTGIREPISKHISNMYQIITEGEGQYTGLFNLSKDLSQFWDSGGDAQVLFDKILETKLSTGTFNASIFMDQFKESIIDLSAHHFDKEKGYTIVKEGNIEVFVYQIERLNYIVKEMSEWIGQTPFDEWKISNEASFKWIASSYKQAQKEITFSQEYCDRCYNDPWIQHFYSQEDIEKFKARWRSHIKS